MASLSNYLLSARKRLSLSQEEVAFLVGYTGASKGGAVSRQEALLREPTLRAALAYEIVYARPVQELFAGIYEEVEQEVGERAKVLRHRVSQEPNPKRDEVVTNLISRISKLQ